MTKKYTRNVFRDGKEITINGKRVKEHRYIWEQYYHVKLGPHDQISWRNGDKIDNRIENLYKLTPRQGQASWRMGRANP